MVVVTVVIGLDLTNRSGSNKGDRRTDILRFSVYYDVSPQDKYVPTRHYKENAVRRAILSGIFIEYGDEYLFDVAVVDVLGDVLGDYVFVVG